MPGDTRYRITLYSILIVRILSCELIFDGAAKLNEISLNNTLHIFYMLLDFRIHKIDIKHFRNILISLNHTDYQRILCRLSPNEPIKEYC